MKGIMIQGTASSVGKSLITTALCRLFYQEGYCTTPFKAQNVTSNYYMNDQGENIAKSQAIQAIAAHTVPSFLMNPTSLRLGSTQSASFILGKSAETPDQLDEESTYEKWIHAIQFSLEKLGRQYDLIVAEGASSPVELNLKTRDAANMKVAELADVPVLLVSDIDRGGVFASVKGTLELLLPEERERVKGIIINKFRGDTDRFRDGVILMEQITGLPVLGVLPYLEHDIEEEDDPALLTDDPPAGTLSLPTDEQIEDLAQTMKQHLDWQQFVDIAEQWDSR